MVLNMKDLAVNSDMIRYFIDNVRNFSSYVLLTNFQCVAFRIYHGDTTFLQFCWKFNSAKCNEAIYAI